MHDRIRRNLSPLILGVSLLSAALTAVGIGILLAWSLAIPLGVFALVLVWLGFVALDDEPSV